ncbi:hypothetical protein HP532_07210 [Pseudomonas sp. CrR25]|nr:hypothetical protein [Pseudomonas sp. CrR25]
MKHCLFILLALIPLIANAKPATELAGRYVLQGARETSSTLLLKDGINGVIDSWLPDTPQTNG